MSGHHIFNPNANRVVCGGCETKYHTSYTACPECSGGSKGGTWWAAETESVAIVERESR